MTEPLFDCPTVLGVSVHLFALIPGDEAVGGYLCLCFFILGMCEAYEYVWVCESLFLSESE